jgi:metal-responsive CopG/Arc/MetJ family transcriptional regulator
MKTAISLPDVIFLEAEKTAQYLGISRSALYLKALTEYLNKNNRKNITKKLNEVYAEPEVHSDDYFKEFVPIENASRESIRELTKNGTW